MGLGKSTKAEETPRTKAERQECGPLVRGTIRRPPGWRGRSRGRGMIEIPELQSREMI